MLAHFRIHPIPLSFLFPLLLIGCAELESSPDAGLADGPRFDAVTCQKGQDADGDTIPDDLEGCGKDTDGDQLPDYLDPDSDGDGIRDDVEVGSDPRAPRDSDGDKTPDFQDTDSDGDGVNDGDEDLNGDGKVGCCLDTCGEVRKGCPTVASTACGAGQTCSAGACSPRPHWLCSNGESDPTAKRTFTEAKKDDGSLPTYVCHKAGELAPKGLKPIQIRASTSGAWRVALEKNSSYGEIAIKAAATAEAGATFDLTGTDQQVAGFVLSLPAPASTDVSQVVGDLAAKIASLTGLSSSALVASGSKKTSLDGFPTVVSTRINLATSKAMTVSALRDALLPLLLGKQVSQLPTDFGKAGAAFHLRFSTLLRDQKDKRLLIMGAVAPLDMVNNLYKPTFMHMEDLSNGTGLTEPSNNAMVECDPFNLGNDPVADIIWVVDESGSMDDNRKDIVNNASDFFKRAQSGGLDFRMGVAGMAPPSSSSVKGGKFCSKTSFSSDHDGGTDRFLEPSEIDIFKGCIKNPPYYDGAFEYGLAHTYEAVKIHLPRVAAASKDSTKIRKEAQLVVIIVSDEAPNELKVNQGYKGKYGMLTTADYSIANCTTSKQSKIDTYLADWKTLLTGQHATWKTDAAATVHLISGVCQKKCGSYGPEYPRGYIDLVKATGGQWADICQKDLGASLQTMIDAIIGASSPAKLQYVPISASIAVAVDRTDIPRSRIKGYYYYGASNTLVFLNTPFKKGDLAVASYRRWTKQVTVK